MFYKIRQLLAFIFQIPDTSPATGQTDGIPYRWVIAGSLLLFLFGFLWFLSPQFAPDVPLQNQPILTMTTVFILAGLVYLFLSELIHHSHTGKRLLIWILLIGGGIRALMFFSTPILEVDFNRYFWDGAVTASGFNPYAYSPEEILSSANGIAVTGQQIPDGLTKLATSPGSTIENVNHSYLRTIYPPITQAIYALSYWISPWSMPAWRFILLCFDVITLLLIFNLLRYLNLSPIWASIYWLNPLLVKEIFNSGHMDILILPFLLSAFLFSFQQRPYWAMAFLALAIGVKVWPVVLLPLFLRPLLPDYKQAARALTLFGGICLILFLPIFLTGLDEGSGFNAYSNRWQLNDTFFKVTLGVSFLWLKITGGPEWEIYALARRITLVITAAWILTITFKKSESPQNTLDQALLIIAGMYLISPTQFPWYVVWLVPFLVASPRRPLLFLTLLLPIYYFRYYFEAHGNAELFDNYIVWIEFTPVWILILREWWLNRQFKNLTRISTNRS